MVKSSLRVLGVLAVFLCCALITLQVPSIKKDLLIWVIEKGLDEPDHKVIIDTVDGVLPFTLKVPNLEIQDNGDPWLRLKQIDIKVSWLPFKIDFIQLEEIKILKQPIFQSASINVLALIPGLLQQRTLQKFQVDTITLDPSLLGKNYEAKFGWQLNPIKGQDITFKNSSGDFSGTVIQTKEDEIEVEAIHFCYQDSFLKGEAKVSYLKNFQTVLNLSATHPCLPTALPFTLKVNFNPRDKMTKLESEVDVTSFEKLKNILGEKVNCSVAIKKDQGMLAVEDIVLSFSGKTLKGGFSINNETQDLKGVLKGNLFQSDQPLIAMFEGTLMHPHLKITSPSHQATVDISWDQPSDNLKFDCLVKKLTTADFTLDGFAAKGEINTALTGQASLQLAAGKINTIAIGKSSLTLKLDKGRGVYQLDSAQTSRASGLNINSKGQVSLEKDNPKIKGDFNIKSAVARSKKKSGQLARKNIEIKTTFEWSLQQLAWNAVYQPTSDEPLNFKGTLKLQGGNPTLDSPCQITVNGQFNLSALMPWISNGDRVSGKALINLIITGNCANPMLQGTVKVKKGFYEISEFGTCIGNIELDLQAKGSTLTIQNLQATDGTKRPSPEGQVIGEGKIQIKELFHPLMDVSLKVQDFQVAASDSFFARADGNVTFKGPCLDAKVEGAVTLNPAKLMLEEVNPIPTIPAIKMMGPSLETRPQNNKKAVLKIFPILLKLKAPKRFMIQGFGLESLWEGEMDVVGHLSDTQLLGTISLVKGKLDLLGKVMKISQGRISYDQIAPNDPVLSITAVREIDGVTINLVVEGRASSPRFTFLSTPALPEEEILSRLLFGRELNKISVGQSLQLAAAVASMHGQKGLNIMDKVRSSFGLDILEIKESKNDGNGNTSQAVSIGKEFGKVRISLDQAVTSGRSKATISTAITPSLNLDIDIGGPQSSNIGLSWIKRY